MKLPHLILLAAATLLQTACLSRGYNADKAMKKYNHAFDNVDKAVEKDKKTHDKRFGTGSNNSSW